MILVTAFSQGGTPPLEWTMRTAIGEGAARGIVYLHTELERPLVHRDIKSANILLDEHFIPKVREHEGEPAHCFLLTGD